MIHLPIKHLTTTSPDYADLTAEMIDSSGVSDWEIIDETEQGDFGSANFNLLCNRRARRVYEILCEGNPVFVCDGDVHWFEPLNLEGTSFDILAQHDPDTGICAGVCYWNNTEVAKLIARYVAEWGEGNARFNDQVILNAVLHQVRSHGGRPRIGYVPTVYSWGLLRKDESLWEGQEFDLPSDATAFHANYVVGLEGKRKLLDYVKGKR